MGIDLNRFRAAREEAEAKMKDRDAGAKGPGFWKAKDPGFHGIFVCPPSDDMDGFPFLGGLDGVFVHYQVGTENRMHICLAEDNAVVWSDPMSDALDRLNATRARNGKPEWVVKLDAGDGCPTCAECRDHDSSHSEEKRKSMGRNQLWLHNVIPWWVMGLTGGKRIEEAAKEIRPWWASYKQWKGICDVITLNGDVTDPTNATLTVIKRTGKAFHDTRYEVSSDAESLRSPMTLPKPLRSLLASSTGPGGVNNLYALTAGLIRSADSVADILRGAPVSATKTVVAAQGKPSCFEADCDPSDRECQACPHKVACASACGVSVPGEMQTAPKLLMPEARPAAPEGKPAPSASAPRVATPAPIPAPIPASASIPAPARAPAPAVKAKPAPPPEEDEDEELAAFARELAEARKK